MRLAVVAALFVAWGVSAPCQAQLLKTKSGDWPWWRGPQGNGIAQSGQRPPVAWSDSQNVKWKVDVPGRGHSSPTVAAGRVLLATADDAKQTQSILCFDRNSGDQLWTRQVNQGGFPGKINRKNTHASTSIAVFGDRLFASFLNHDAIQLICLDLNGKEHWRRTTGGFTPDAYRNGYAASPLLYGKLVIVAGDFDGDAFLVAFDRATGEKTWRVSRPSRINYASPVIARIDGRDQLLLSGGDIVAGYDPGNGKQLWKTAATTMATAGTMVWDGNLVFASGGYPKAETVCIRADGSGELIWKNNHKCYEQSMLAYRGYVYAVNDTGIALCWDAKTGKEQWRERLRGPLSASPVLADGKIFVCNERGATWVYEASPKAFELVAKNQLGSEAFASPTICGGQLFLRVADSSGGRRQEVLYCIEDKGAE